MNFLRCVRNLLMKRCRSIHAASIKYNDAVSTSLQDEVIKQKHELLDLIRLLNTL